MFIFKQVKKSWATISLLDLMTNLDPPEPSNPLTMSVGQLHHSNWGIMYPTLNPRCVYRGCKKIQL